VFIKPLLSQEANYNVAKFLLQALAGNDKVLTAKKNL